ncbi:hypothetical protein GQ457_03G010410 [Hibiscus cannabinus]
MAFQQNSGLGSRLSSSSGFQYLNSPFGDTTYTKVFVGGLAWEPKAKHCAAVSSSLVRFWRSLSSLIRTLAVQKDTVL